jgi:hydrogenase-4 component B
VTGVVLLAGCVLVALGGGVCLLRRRLVRGLEVQLAGIVVLAAGALVVFASGSAVGAPFHSALTPALGLDRLSAFFVLVVALAAVPALLFARDTLAAEPHAGPLGAVTAAFVLVLVGVLAARDVVTFLAGWELMTLLPAAAILLLRRYRAVRRVVFVYLAITHLGGVGVWVALLALSDAGAIGVGGAPPTGGLQALVAVAALVGFGTKAGLMPLHAWLPRAHPVAPSHVSALMSGVMVEVALYGLIRVLFEWDGPAPLWVGLGLLGLGLVSALGGILYALVQRELKRLLAFSTIENVGIVALGLGASLVLAATGAPEWSALAFAAALLHVAAHAVAKALLFLGAGAIGRATGGELELDRLGGLLARMPWSGWSFLAGCAALAGLVPLAGVVSEWLTLQALLHVAYQDAPGVALAGALAAAGLAATAALAALCFTTVAGLALLGPSRGPAAASAVEAPRSTRAALALLAALCVAGGLASAALVPLLGGMGPSGTRPPVGIGLGLPSTGGLPLAGIALALTVAVGLARLATRGPRTRTQPAWACGQRVEPALAWTAAGFTKPLRLTLERVLRPRREVVVHAAPNGIAREVVHRAEVPHLFDAWLYAPAQRVALRGATVARRLQSGSLRAYLGYLLALLTVVLGLARLGWLT